MQPQIIMFKLNTMIYLLKSAAAGDVLNSANPHT